MIQNNFDKEQISFGNFRKKKIIIKSYKCQRDGWHLSDEGGAHFQKQISFSIKAPQQNSLSEHWSSVE